MQRPSVSCSGGPGGDSGGPGRYVVFVGREPGIYRTWDECNRQVYAYPGGTCKKFETWERASSEWMRFLAKESMKKFPRHGTNRVPNVRWEGDVNFGPLLSPSPSPPSSPSAFDTASASPVGPTMKETVKNEKMCVEVHMSNVAAAATTKSKFAYFVFGIFLGISLTLYVMLS